MCRWEDELDGRKGSERTGGCVDMAELGEIHRSEMTDGLEYKEELLVDYAVFYGEPVELLQDRCYVTDVGGSCDDTGCRVSHFDL